jgi:RNase adaptor protein for sRNA GlmZ degradation
MLNEITHLSEQPTKRISINADTRIRYSETRRKHPLTNHTTELRAAITNKQKLLDPIISYTDLVINTSQTNSSEPEYPVISILAMLTLPSHSDVSVNNMVGFT